MILRMKLSMKVEYACRVLSQLARTFGHERLAHIEDLARAEEIPANYLVQILNDLRNGGLIVSRRGKQGGYALAKPPEEISLHDIVQVIEGELLELNLNARGQSGAKVASVWRDISAEMRERAASISVRDLMPTESEPMYHI